MKKVRKTPRPRRDELRAEYAFDYDKSRPNRFASSMAEPVVAVVLEPDVAQVFGSSASVNQLLRSVIKAVPAIRHRRPNPRRKAG
jgi:hypothetical protein